MSRHRAPEATKPQGWRRVLLAMLTVASLLTVTTALTAGAAPTAAGGITTWSADQGKIVFLGDSMQTGFGCARAYDSYAWRLEFFYPGTQMIRLAHEGAAASDYLPGGRWPETVTAVDRIRIEQPALVVIALGAVDYGFFSRNADMYAAEIAQLTALVRVASPRATLLFIHTNGFRMHTAALYEDYGRRMNALADAQLNASYQDEAAAWPWYDGSAYANEFYFDNPHPNCVMKVGITAQLNAKLEAMRAGVR